MAQEIKSTYKCTEQELYAISELGYNNLETDLAAFAAKKGKYTPAFLTALRLTRTQAMNLPDEEARNANHQIVKNKLVSTFLPPVLDNFNDLKGYIKEKALVTHKHSAALQRRLRSTQFYPQF